MKIVIDTNVVASAIFFGGKPRQLIDKLVNKEFEACATKEIIAEYRETIEYLFEKYPSKQVGSPLEIITGTMTIIKTTSSIDVCRDPDDNKFIECAIDAECLYIVSGDKDLLTVEKYEDIRIMTVAEFLDLA
ncbi:MAG: putative toxin-antitoxin system toxin component, PIN family [Lachnospiraceae bacterium]|nr:putative toxin-antitoxin system toxin component, PIN family [Lachnospiraceae bacterium]